ncbi:MAG: efflux RND transporter permease subunit, partial [Akkermansiaceae bacterium]|nr:efflux RND transporter permease subunit [Akkermansiaceae bacterium]
MSESSTERGPIAWMARHSIAANLLMLLLLVGGFYTAINIQKEVFPDAQLDVVEVMVEYPGAAPSVVEQGVFLPVVVAVQGFEGLRETLSVSRVGRGMVMIEL